MVTHQRWRIRLRIVHSRGQDSSIRAFGRRHRHTRCVPVTPLVSTPIKHSLVKEKRRGSTPPPRFAVARDALPSVIITCHCHPHAMAVFERTHEHRHAGETNVGRERANRRHSNLISLIVTFLSLCVCVVRLAFLEPRN